MIEIDLHHHPLFLIKLLIIVSFSIGTSSTAQVTFLGFDRTTCIQPMNDTYTYSNYSSGGGSGAVYGYNIYRNGALVFGDGGTMGDGKSCRELIFINDSIGFLVYYSGNTSNRVLRTSDHGHTWTDIGGGAPDYFGLYVATPHTAYIVTYWNTPQQLYVGRCSDVPSRVNFSFIYDSSINTDVFTADTLSENDLCNQDSLLIHVSNGTDSVTYHIRFHILVAGIDNAIANDPPGYRIFPNPSESYFSVSGEVEQIQTIELMNTLGETVRRFDVQAVERNLFPLQGLYASVYFVRLNTRSGKQYLVRLSKR